MNIFKMMHWMLNLLQLEMHMHYIVISDSKRVHFTCTLLKGRRSMINIISLLAAR